MRPFVYTITPAAVSASNIAASQKPGGAGNLTLTTKVLDYARILAITSDADDSAHSFAVTGTDQDGNVISETVSTGPSSGSVNTVNYYLTIATIHISGAATGNITVGTTNKILGKTLPLEFRSTVAPEVAIVVSGTISITVNNAFSDVLGVSGPYTFMAASTGLTTKTANTFGQVAVGATAAQLQVNSYSTGATVSMTVITPRQLC